jgi:hypothetical protein
MPGRDVLSRIHQGPRQSGSCPSRCGCLCVAVDAAYCVHSLVILRTRPLLPSCNQDSRCSSPNPPSARVCHSRSLPPTRAGVSLVCNRTDTLGAGIGASVPGMMVATNRLRTLPCCTWACMEAPTHDLLCCPGAFQDLGDISYN